MPAPRRARPVSDSFSAAITATCGKWKLIVIYWLAESPKRFTELRQLLPGISQKVLTEQLRQLITDGIISRESTGPSPAPFVYLLTDHGRTLVPIVEAFGDWGRMHSVRLNGEALEPAQGD